MPAIAKFTGGITSPHAARAIGLIWREELDTLYKNKLESSLKQDLPGHYKDTVEQQFVGIGLNIQMRVYSNAEGIKQIEEGRPPGGKVKRRKILAWVRKKNLGARAVSVRTRRSLSIGIKPSFDRKAGKLRSPAKTLRNIEVGISYAISKNIEREGLPRNTGFKPSHNLRVFENLKQKHAADIQATRDRAGERIAAYLNQ
jgi:hypothetical protein